MKGKTYIRKKSLSKLLKPNGELVFHYAEYDSDSCYELTFKIKKLEKIPLSQKLKETWNSFVEWFKL